VTLLPVAKSRLARFFQSDTVPTVSVRPGPPCAGAVSWEDRRSA